MNVKNSLLLFALFILFNACHQIQALEFKNIDHFEIVSASLKETQISLDLIIENPNTFTIDVKKIRCALYKDDQQIGTINSDSIMHFKANKDATIRLQTSVESKKIISNAFDMLLNADQSVRFRVIGTDTIGRGKVFITIPVQYSMEKKWNEIVR